MSKNLSSLFNKISTLSKKKVNDIPSALDALCIVSQLNDGRRVKALSLASQVDFLAADEALQWVKGTIDNLLDAVENGRWYAKPRSSQFLFALNISVQTEYFNKLHILGDYVLSHEFPSNEEQLLDQLRIVNLLFNVGEESDERLPTGPMVLLSRVLSADYPLNFTISPKTRSITIKMFNQLMQFKSARAVFPEVTASIATGGELDKIHAAANVEYENRIDEILGRREYPPMIVQIEPRTFYKAKQRSEAQKLKKQIRRETAAITRDVKKKNEELILKQYKENIEKRDKKEKENRKALALLNEQNNITLDVAAEEPKTKEEEEEEKNEGSDVPEEKEKKHRDFDPDIGYDDDDSEEEEEEYDDDE